MEAGNAANVSNDCKRANNFPAFNMSRICVIAELRRKLFKRTGYTVSKTAFYTLVELAIRRILFVFNSLRDV